MILFLIGICISFHVVMGDLAPGLAAQVLDLHNTPSLRATMLLGERERERVYDEFFDGFLYLLFSK